MSGVAGTGKTTFARRFVDAACDRGERCMYFVFEEGADRSAERALGRASTCKAASTAAC